MRPIVVPGKLILIGEYGVVEGGRALTCALKPGYEFSSESLGDAHPDSPAGRFARRFRDQDQTARIPALRGTGLGLGFGSSTAELVACVMASTGEAPELHELWSWFREEFPNMSGADLATQVFAASTGVFAASAGSSVFRIPQKGQIQIVPEISSSVRSLRVFRTPADRKQKTHEDLALRREPVSVSELDRLVLRLENAIASDRIEEFRVLSEFANELRATGRESAFSSAVRRDFESVDGVVGAKGCGAGLHDVFLVAADFDTRNDSKIDTKIEHELNQVALRHGLHSLGTLGGLLW